MPKVEILSEAKQQIRDIALYHKMKVGPNSARKITDKLLDAIEQLGEFPEMGVRPPSDIVAETGYRMLIVDKYLCFYSIVGDVLYVSHVVHGSTDYMRVLLRD